MATQTRIKQWNPANQRKQHETLAVLQPIVPIQEQASLPEAPYQRFDERFAVKRPIDVPRLGMSKSAM